MVGLSGDTRRVTEAVWVPNWEVQCCGRPFATGETVHWPVSRAGSADWLEDRLSRVGRGNAAYLYSAHGVEGDEGLCALTAIVESIEAMHCDLHPEVHPRIGGTVLFPTAGTERLTPVDSDRMWELEPTDHTQVHFAGWLVQVTTLGLEPTRVDEPREEHRVNAWAARAVSWTRRRRGGKNRE